MAKPKSRPPGRLSVTLQSDSYLLENRVPIEVRDSRRKLIKTLRRSGALELEDGLYEISAVLQDGKKHSHIVHLKSGAEEPVVLGAGIEKARAAPALPLKSDAKLVRAERANVLSSDQDYWLFGPNYPVDSVPRATFDIAARSVEVSLPVNPQGHGAESACEVRVSARRSGPEVRAWITSKRTVASALQHMLASGYILQAAEIATEATELLRGKYRDPTGAVLGALILHKAGTLAERQAWVENLAKDFSWMPDGKVLLAVLLAQDKKDESRVQELVLSASSQPMMFTESYSLLLNLLRRWPWKNESDLRTNALEALSETAPYTDWEAITWTHWLPNED